MRDGFRPKDLSRDYEIVVGIEARCKDCKELIGTDSVDDWKIGFDVRGHCKKTGHTVEVRTRTDHWFHKGDDD